MGNPFVLQFMIRISGRQDMDEVLRRRRFAGRALVAAVAAGLMAVSEISMSAAPGAAHWWRQ
jgi:hypothetical protein